MVSCISSPSLRWSWNWGMVWVGRDLKYPWVPPSNANGTWLVSPMCGHRTRAGLGHSWTQWSWRSFPTSVIPWYPGWLWNSIWRFYRSSVNLVGRKSARSSWAFCSKGDKEPKSRCIRIFCLHISSLSRYLKSHLSSWSLSWVSGAGCKAPDKH